jgi:phage FluMu protein Com
MDQEFSNELTGLMPVVPHGISGVDCSGRIIAAVEDNDVELRCNRCGAVVGVVQINIMEGLLGLDCAEATCPQCGEVNAFSSFSEISTYVCDQCGNTVELGGGVERVEINGDTCRWYTFENAEPIAVICCTCGRHPDVDGDGVRCPCGRRSYVGARDIMAAIAVWNQMPATGE